MAHLFRPVAVKPVPAAAEKCTQGGRPAVRWRNRKGEWVVAPLSRAAPGKCRVRSPYWWVEYRDAQGRRKRERVSKVRAAAESRLGQLVEDVERERGGLAPLRAAPLFETLPALAAEYRDHLRDLGRSEKHYLQTHKQIADVLAECGWALAKDVTLERWVRWVGEARRGDAGGAGLSAETVNHYLRAVRGFFRWLVRCRRLGADPLAAAQLLDAGADRRLFRRRLEPAEFRKLIDATRLSPRTWYRLDGRARAALYLVAARTGLRAGVLARLRPEDLRLQATVPHIPVPAAWQKARKEHRAPVPPAVVAELAGWLQSRPAGELLWPGIWHRRNKAAEMLRRDLRAAGLPEVTNEGGYDFHALRGQCATDLALAGVPLSVAQEYLGHSTPELTARYYVRVGMADLGAAAAKLGPGLGQAPGEVSGTVGTRRRAGKGRKG
jgi:integrase